MDEADRREQLEHQLGRVKEWVRFPEPFKQIQERTRQLFGAAGDGAER